MGRVYFLVYRVLINLLLPVVLLRYLLKGMTRREYRHRLTERFGWIPKPVCTGSIWIHAVSVGEVNAAAPLVRHLLDAQNLPVLISCVTPTGSAQITRLFGDRVGHVYAPVDSGFAVSKALKTLQPRAVIIVETELWPILIHGVSARNIPIAFVNLRISDLTFKRARYLKPLCRFALRDVQSFCVQTETDAERIIALGAQTSRVSKTGNLKFDMEAPPGIQDQAAELRDMWGGPSRPTIVLGSSHQGEERPFMEMLVRLRETYPELVALIVPRHPERFEAVHQEISTFGLRVVRRSEWPADSQVNADVIMVDTMGELMLFYAASDVAIVGGSFAAAGGHNILEPILVGTPTLFGPGMSNFREITRLVVAADTGLQVQSFEKLHEALKDHLDDPGLRESRIRNGYKLLQANRGALEKTVGNLQPILNG